MQQHYEAYWNRESPPPLTDPLALTRERILWDLLSPDRSQGGSFLDVGCGSGWLVGRALERGFHAQGMDIAEGAVERARADYPGATFVAHSTDILPWPIERDSIDVVTCFEVIEHLLESQQLIQGIREVLHPGGFAAITTPYHGLVKNLALSIHGFDHHFSVTGDHIRFFSDNALKQLVESEGFRVERMAHYGRLPLVWSGVMAWARKV